jgi:putative transposase
LPERCQNGIDAVPFARRAWAERGIWQRRFWEHLIRDDADDARHVEYGHINPLKHGLVERVSDWPYSAFHRDVGAGCFRVDWGGDVEAIGELGER